MANQDVQLRSPGSSPQDISLSSAAAEAVGGVTVHVNVAGTWKAVTKVYVKVSGNWQVATPWIKASTVWKS
jgi:hypothetical protein